MNTQQTLDIETELNNKVLERIMGWRVVEYTKTYGDPVWGDDSGLMVPFHPVATIKTALEAFKHFLAKPPQAKDVTMSFYYLEDERIVCRLSSNLWDVESGPHTTEALALCDALLKADEGLEKQTVLT